MPMTNPSGAIRATVNATFSAHGSQTRAESMEDTTTWSAPVASGALYAESVTWSSPGDYHARVRARDTKGAISVWSWPCTTVVEMVEPKWRFETRSSVYSSPALAADGTVYVGSWDSCLYAINPDGMLRWRYQTGIV